MSLKYVLGYALYVGTLVLAKPVEPPSASSVPDSAGGAIELHPPSDPVALTLEPTSASSDSITWPNVTGGNSIHVQCDGVSYGFDLDIVDCEEAKAYVPPSPDQVQWAERHTGWQKQIFPLPYRSMGNKASCYVEPILISGATSARANLNEVRNAAAAIRNRCAFGGKLQGGIAINIGKEKTPLLKISR